MEKADCDLAGSPCGATRIGKATPVVVIVIRSSSQGMNVGEVDDAEA